MGLLISFMQSFSKLGGTPREAKVLFCGLYGAGKTTLLYKMKLGMVVETIPTTGFIVETVEYKQLSLTCWDIGTPLWRHYLEKPDAVIFVVDSVDKLRLKEAAEKLASLLTEDLLRNTIFLLLANKQDLPNALTAEELAEELGMKKNQTHKWHIQATSAHTGEGIYEGLDWIELNLPSEQEA
ncbi:unnamed protein product, partial [Mesorhabditis spiculigera]